MPRRGGSCFQVVDFFFERGCEFFRSQGRFSNAPRHCNAVSSTLSDASAKNKHSGAKIRLISSLTSKDEAPKRPRTGARPTQRRRLRRHCFFLPRRRRRCFPRRAPPRPGPWPGRARRAACSEEVELLLSLQPPGTSGERRAEQTRRESKSLSRVV